MASTRALFVRPAATATVAVPSLRSDPPAPEALPDLHPALWRAHQLGRAAQGVCASGYAALDAELPGGGWPAQALTELLLPHPGVGELRLLAPALVALQPRGLLWVNPPARPCAWALSALGLDLRQLVVVHAGLRPADGLWALEQALRSGALGAVLAWLPQRLPADALRRLQLAAQGHDGPVFLLRDAPAQANPSPAPLRLRLDSAGPDGLGVQVLKRRGPPAAAALSLRLPPVLSEPARERARDRVQGRVGDRSPARRGQSLDPGAEALALSHRSAAVVAPVAPVRRPDAV